MRYWCLARALRYLIPFSFLGVLVLCCPAEGFQEHTTKTGSPSGAMCGLYCLYGALRAEGQAVNIHDLVRAEYLGSKEGSSMAELRQAALDYGMHAKAVDNCTIAVLRQLASPVILHVKSAPDVREYKHWVLYYGSSGSSAMIYDPANGWNRMEATDLSQRWDGKALMVSANSISSTRIWYAAIIDIAIRIIPVCILVGIVGWMWKRYCAIGQSIPAFVGNTIAQAMILVMISLGVGFVYHSKAESGLLRSPQATAGVKEAYLEEFLAKLSIDDVKHAMAQGATIIDARFHADYQMGHLPGAINIPVDSDSASRKIAIGGLAKDTRIIIYCQSKGCPFAGMVARQLIKDEYQQVEIFTEGWVGWQASLKDVIATSK